MLYNLHLSRKSLKKKKKQWCNLLLDDDDDDDDFYIVYLPFPHARSRFNKFPNLWVCIEQRATSM
jgi:hypothetical protein